jgi:predicted nucleic acid-binding protein
VRVVVADTGPLQYLVLTGAIDVLPKLYGAVTAPAAVHGELLHPVAPAAVRNWAAAPPAWLTIVPAPVSADPQLRKLDAGEAAAIALALMLRADLVLMDERAGVTTARARALNVIGTIDVLDQAARAGLIDIAAAVARLRATNFRHRPACWTDCWRTIGQQVGGHEWRCSGAVVARQYFTHAAARLPYPRTMALPPGPTAATAALHRRAQGPAPDQKPCPYNELGGQAWIVAGRDRDPVHTAGPASSRQPIQPC